MELNSHYKKKDSIYFSQIRWDLIEFVSKDSRVLEIGAGTGETLMTLKKEGISTECIGVELIETPDSNQNSRLIDNFIFGNIESIELPIQESYFDVIICGDVLEHLYDPWKVAGKLYKYLKPGGRVIICCPNIRDVFVWSKIIMSGDFHYTQSGSLDKTHIRFFCSKNLSDLSSLAGFKNQKIVPNFYLTPKRKLLSKLTFGLFDDFLAPQNIVVAEK